MRKGFITAATAAVLLVFAAVLDARPLKAPTQCLSGQASVPDGTIHLFQTFKPTFSNLKSISLALFGYYLQGGAPLTDDVTLRMYVMTDSPGTGPFTQLGYVDSVLLAGTVIEDAASGYTITFTFTEAIPVTPGDTYTFEIAQQDYYPNDVVRACYSDDDYLDGSRYVNTNVQSDDLAFKMTGSGRGSPPK